MQRQPSTLSRDISPPATRKAFRKDANEHKSQPSLAAIEAGQKEIRNHLQRFAEDFERVSRPRVGPRIPIQDFKALYKRNEHKHGQHFVIHQHDHPVSGVHYDLRLQFSDSSTASWAIPYGMPGNPNSVRPNRMAIETRVHNLWNNLIESASHATGSLLIWDTGQYEVLPPKESKVRTTDDELSDMDGGSPSSKLSHNERLCVAFQRRHIRLRLRGTRLPPDYTVSLRLPSNNYRDAQPGRPKRKRRRLDPAKLARRNTGSQTGSDSDQPSETLLVDPADDAAAQASEDEADATIRINNAYTGATNSIGSIHQRHWFLTLDRKNSGFRQASSGRWEGPWEAFFVRGREVETSVVTGRKAEDVMADEGVKEFRGRKMWRAIVE